MTRIRNRRFAILLLFILLSGWQIAAQDFQLTPLNQSYLRDDVGLLDRGQREEISKILERQNQSSPGRIYLDILPQLPAGKTLERYAFARLNEDPRDADEKADKIMLVISLKERMVRIETSPDVQHILTDDYCHRVNREIMAPRFQAGDYYEGLKAGIEALIKKLKAG